MVKRHIVKYLECQEMFCVQKLGQKSPFCSAALSVVGGALKRLRAVWKYCDTSLAGILL